MTDDSRTTILTIEDEDHVRESIAAYLEDSGYTVFQAENGRIGLEIFRRESPSLILVDLRMPEMDGLEVLAIIAVESPDTPIIVVSGSGIIGDAVEALHLGAWDYILKPIEDMGVLAHSVHRALERHRLLQENKQHQKHLEELVRKRTIELEKEIDERKRAEKALRESEEKYRTVLEANPDPVIVYNTEGRVVYCNPAFTRVFGWSLEERIGKKMDIYIPDGEREVTKEMIDKVMAGECITGIETRRFTMDGALIPVSASGAAYLDRDGRPMLTIINLRDTREQVKLRAQLQQAQKMEAIGTLAGGVAHDFNNMLGAIIGYAELTMDQMPPDHRFRKNLSHILDAAQRSANLTRQLLMFARKQDVVQTTFDINDSVNSILKMLRRLIDENIELEWEPGDGPNIVRMDQTQLDQILANLCVNAKDAISEVGKISVKTSRVLVGDDYGRTHVEYTPGEYVLISITDNGCGMDEETLEHIFEPFYTTKEMGKGTGLGLATVYGIVKQNHGMINVYSEPGIGTSFNIYLPLHTGEDEAKGHTNNVEFPKSRGEIILIVEDDEVVLEMGCATLKRLGYNILSANTPEDAIHLVESEPGEIHMFITDMVMPKMNGKELAKQIKKIRPEIRCLFMSGYTANILSQADEVDNELNFIRKPFSFRDFACKIREVLDAN